MQRTSLCSWVVGFVLSRGEGGRFSCPDKGSGHNARAFTTCHRSLHWRGFQGAYLQLEAPRLPKVVSFLVPMSC